MGAASGKLDAWIFGAGLLLGIWLFAEAYAVIYDFAWSGGMGTVTLPGLLGLPAWSVALLLLPIAGGLFWLARTVEGKR